MHQRLAFLIMLAAGGHLAVAADQAPLKERVAAFCQKFPTAKQVQERAAEWLRSEPDNPDAYILPANAYLKLASSVSVTTGDQKGAFANLVDPKTDKVVGTMAAGSDPELQQRALSLLTLATKKFPQRMDIHVGRMASAQRCNAIAELRTAVSDLIVAVSKDAKGMLWIDGAKLDMDASQKAVREVHGRIYWLYALRTEAGDQAAHASAVQALPLLPADVELLNDVAIYHLYHSEWKAARDYLLRAEKVVPKDWIVQHNIARASAELGDKADARRRLRAIIQGAPDSDDSKAAQEALDGLEEKPAK